MRQKKLSKYLGAYTTHLSKSTVNSSNSSQRNKKLSTMDCGLSTVDYYGLWTKTGFTLLEILVVLMILGFLTAMVSGHFSRIKGEAAVVTALNEMKDIKEVIRDRFYPDLGLIPEDTANPEWATRFLCFNKDCTDADIQAAIACSDLGGECEKMCDFLETRLGSFTQAQRFLQWDKYSRKGWHGLFIEQEITAYDSVNNEWYPIIINPWGKRVDSAIDPDRVIGEYRIVYDEMDLTPGITREDERLSSRIVSFGANGIDDGGGTTPLPADTGDDLVMFIFGTGATRRP